MRVTTDPAVKPDVVIRLTWDEAQYMRAILVRGMEITGACGSLAYDMSRALTIMDATV